MLWFIRGVRRGVVTTRYPARPDESARFLPAPPAFRPQALTRETADRLAATCPSGALRHEKGEGPGGTGGGSPPCEEEAGGDTLIFDLGRCTACGRCAAEAPHAVTSSGEFELAATGRSVLIKRIPLRGEAR
jgi:dissimilatory sulfite reductase (desulfoviridin) alpha/beta subunit